jgi:hypothetical protein
MRIIRIRILLNPLTADDCNEGIKGFFPELAGIEFTQVTSEKVVEKILLKTEFMAPNGYLHAGMGNSIRYRLCLGNPPSHGT